VSSYVEEIGVNFGYDGNKALHQQSHGESFLTVLNNHFHSDGLYILDEPEAALSPMRQMTLLARMHQLTQAGSQFIIATHSPIIMAYPEATIYSLSGGAIRPIAYEDTEHYKVTRGFLENPARSFRVLFEQE
jgi:predicted ATPase